MTRFTNRLTAAIAVTVCTLTFAVAQTTPCVNGSAGAYACQEVDLLAHLTTAELGAGGADASDVWGWTDPQDGKEYVILGTETGTAFVDISDPENPVYLGRLATNMQFPSPWRDIKVYGNHAYIVADYYFTQGHGIQIFDLTRLRRVRRPPDDFDADAIYGEFGTAHNIVINEDTGFAYGVGTNTCSGGLHMVDISSPEDPQFAGCFSGDGYTHDAQCVVYAGPDNLFEGSEICFNANEDSLTVVDVSDKAAPQLLSRGFYSQRGYAHQGWLTPDHRYFLLGDETDEQNYGINTRTLIFDVGDLLDVTLIGEHLHSTNAIDHNLYTLGHFVYEGNYLAGLRILDTIDVANGNLTEVAYFDIDPQADGASFSGVWSVYPYFPSGVLAVSHIESGLFLLRANHVKSDVGVNVAADPDPAMLGQSVFYDVTVTNGGPVGATDVVLTDSLPAGVSFVGATPSQGDCSENGGIVTCDVGSLLIGGSATVTIEATVNVTGLLENTADVTATEFDPLMGNNTATTQTESLDPVLDQDADGVANGADCAPFDPDAWTVPTAARDLHIEPAGAGNIQWVAPVDAGGTTVRFDVLRSETPSNFDTATCVESDDVDLLATDATEPVSLFAYLVRAENACGGELGSNSAGAPRSGAACP